MVESNDFPVQMTRVLVGVDFGKPSAAAAAWTARHLAPGAELVLAHAVYVPEPPGFLKSLYPPTERAIETARRGAEQQLRDLGRSIATGLTWPEVRVGRPDEVLAQVATEYAVDLIVLGGRTERAGLWDRLGSTPERVLRRSAVPVLLATGVDATGPRKLLVAVDGSDEARHVLAWTDYLMSRPEVSATLLHVAGAPPAGVVVPGTRGLWMVADAALDEPEATVRAARQWLDAQRATLVHGERATIAALVGSPATEILAEAARQGSDLIVLGAHGRGAVEKLLFGSVAEAVARSAPCSVLMVKRARAGS